jgi:hypothetical protein
MTENEVRDELMNVLLPMHAVECHITEKQDVQHIHRISSHVFSNSLNSGAKVLLNALEAAQHNGLKYVDMRGNR